MKDKKRDRKLKATKADENSPEFAASLLKKVKVIAVRTSGGYHILCNATRIPAVKRLREIIGSERRPLSVMFKTLTSAQKLILLSPKERDLLRREDAPLVVAKLKRLHKIERANYKYTLNNYINPLNNRIALSLPSDDFYEALFKEILFPIVSIDATTPEGEIITTREVLDAVYGDAFVRVIDYAESISPKRREALQIVYGQVRPVSAHCMQEADCMLETKKGRIFDHHFRPLRLLHDVSGHEQPPYTALSMLFAKLPLEDILSLDLAFEKTEIKRLHHLWEEGLETVESDSLLTLYDGIAGVCRLTTRKTFETESLCRAEAFFEVCEEDLFDFEIDGEMIAIDIISEFCRNDSPKHLFSTLTNTVSSIIATLAKAQGRESVTLCGRLFGYRDLAELTIEKLHAEGIAVEW